MPEQASPSTNQPSAANPLLQRLDRRWTQPVSLVNGQRFQANATRLPSAILQRSAFIGQFQTRYGLHEATGTGTDLTFAPRLNGAELGPAASSPGSAPQLSAPAVNPTNTATSPPLFRVSRKPAAQVAPDTSNLLPSASASSPTVQRSTFTEQADTGGSISKGSQVGGEEPPGAEFVMRKPAGSSIETSSSSPVVQRQLDSSSAAQQSPPPLAVAKSMASSPSLPVTQALSPTAFLQRQPKAASSLSSSLPAASPGSVATEVKVPTAAPSTMVWRKSMSESSFKPQPPARPMPSSPSARAAPVTSGSSAGGTANPTMTANQTGMLAPGINIGQVAEQVSRILCRQLAVERERRGIRR